MKNTSAGKLLCLAAAALVSAASTLPAQTSRGASAEIATPAQVRVTTRILVVDREAATRAGLAYAVVGHDRVRVEDRRGRGAHPQELSATAFLELIRDRRLVRTESTQQVLVLSGREARVASTDLAVGRHAARTRGPSFGVIPVVRRDGTVLLRLSARQEDAVRYAWGYGVDGSPAAVDTELLARPGEEVIVASSSVTETARAQGLLSWGSSTRERDVLIAVRAEIPGS